MSADKELDRRPTVHKPSEKFGSEEFEVPQEPDTPSVSSSDVNESDKDEGPVFPF